MTSHPMMTGQKAFLRLLSLSLTACTMRSVTLSSRNTEHSTVNVANQKRNGDVLTDGKL